MKHQRLAHIRNIDAINQQKTTLMAFIRSLAVIVERHSTTLERHKNLSGDKI
jgi:hypothetical protein